MIVHLPVTQSKGTVSEVSMELVRGWKGSLEKSMVEMCWDASGFCLRGLHLDQMD